MKRQQIDFQPEHPDALKDAVRGGEITLILGAGVSRSRNLPDWGELTARVWEKIFGSAYPLMDSDHPFAHQFALELIEEELYTTHYAGPQEGNPFVNAIRGVLYDDLDTRMRGIPGDTLGVIARLLRREATKPDRRIRSVITFNVDSLLEEEVHRYLKSPGPLVWPVSRASDDALRAPGAIRIYHLHGYLPRPSAALRFRVAGGKKIAVPTEMVRKDSKKARKVLKKRRKVSKKTAYHQLIDHAADTFVFTDWQYWRLSTTPLSFANRIFSDALHNSRCIFVGLSMTDVNLIRWLGARSVELELDVRSEFNMSDVSVGARGHRRPHYWIRPGSADPTGLIGRFLLLRGVRSVEIDSWVSRDFERLMSRSFQIRLRR